MQLSLSLLASLLTSTALTLPTTQSVTTSDLSKRDRGPWLGAFQNPKCTGPVAAGVINVLEYTECHKWSPIAGTQYIGINYGSGGLQITNVTFYTDDNCVNQNGENGVVTQVDFKGMQCTSANENTHSFKVAEANN